MEVKVDVTVERREWNPLEEKELICCDLRNPLGANVSIIYMVYMLKRVKTKMKRTTKIRKFVAIIMLVPSPQFFWWERYL